MHVDLARIFQETKVRKWLKFIEFINSDRVEFTSNEYHDLTRFSGQANHIGLLNIRKLDSRGSIHEMKLESV